ncbi:MAG: FliA/WhiG family RNA polymerase sigma factor, partial [Actinomycetota bacterium]|nr:FliA/WhiG family RNA polymerase sigma factor [Actinomycetota bacterium]
AEQLGALWDDFHATRDPRARDELVTAYFPLVKHLSRRIASSLSNHVDLDDLEGYAAEGLLDAVDRYDSTRGAQFATFAAHRIRGAIYDGIRRTDWAPRSVRRKEREIRSNFARLCAEHGREPTEEEEAQALGVGLGALRSSKHQVADAHVGSLDYSHASDEGAAVEPEPRDPAPGPLTRWVESETSLELRTCLESLDERERTVTALSYCEGLTLAEIGARLGVSESRVCQIRSAAIRHLRAYARTHGLVPA